MSDSDLHDPDEPANDEVFQAMANASLRCLDDGDEDVAIHGVEMLRDTAYARANDDRIDEDIAEQLIVLATLILLVDDNRDAYERLYGRVPNETIWTALDVVHKLASEC